MKKTFTFILFFGVLSGFLFVGSKNQASALYECPAGFTWSRETIACEQTTCPANSHRNYTLECTCGTGLTGTYKAIGLLESCQTKEAVQSVPTSTPTLQSSPTFYQDYVNVVPSELSVAFEEIMKQYGDKVPVGTFALTDTPFPYSLFFTPGQANNMFYGANDTACGGYQDHVLKFLLSLYFSKDERQSTLLKGFDFGPIQIEKGAHQAVVLYPKGTDWHVTGIVMDPWTDQKPMVYTIQEWDNMFFGSPEPSVGNIITPIDTNKGKFPTTLDANGNWEYDDVYSPLSRTVRSRKNKGKMISVQSPVDVLITGSNGKKFGLDENGDFVNDFGADVEGVIFRKEAGQWSTTVNLPDGTYTMTLQSIDAGDVHVASSNGEGDIQTFDTVTVKQGEALTVSWDDDFETPKLLDAQDQEVASNLLELAETDTGNPSPFSENSNEFDFSSVVQFVFISIGVLVLVVIVVVVILIVRRKKNKLSQKSEK